MTVASVPAPAAVQTSRVALGVDGWLFLVGAALVPLSNVLPLGLGRIAPSDILFLLLFGVLLQMRGAAIWPYIYRNPVLIPSSIIVGYMITTAAVGRPYESAGQAVLQALSLGFYLLVIIPIFAYYGKHQKIILVILATWVCVDGLLLLLGLIGIPNTGIDTGNGRFRTILTPLGSLATNAAAISALFAFAAILRRKLWGIVGIAVCVFVINMDQSRTALIVFALMFLYVFWVSQSLTGRKADTRLRRVAVASVFVVLLAGAAFVLAANQRFQSGAMLPSDGLQSLDVNRAQGYQASWWAITEHPMLGYGFQTTRATVMEEVVHNGYLQLSADLGIPAGIALIFVLAIPLVRMGRALRVTLKAPRSEIDYDQLLLESLAFFSVFALAVKMCFHPVGLIAQDWIFFIAAAPRYYMSSPYRCLKPAHAIGR